MARLVGAASAAALLVLTALSYGLRIHAAPLPLPVFPAVTIVFITSGSVIVAYVAARAYLRQGLPSMLFVGSGSLVFGLTSLVAALLAGGEGSNAATTIFVLGALASALLHLGCASSRFFDFEEGEGSRPVLSLAFALSVGLVLVLVLSAAEGSIPLFFTPDVGTTLLARAALLAAAVTSGLASLLISISSRSVVLYWYSWALALTAVGLIGLLLSDWVFQAVVFWVGRLGLCLGGIFLVLSVLAAERGADAEPRPEGA